MVGIYVRNFFSFTFCVCHNYRSDCVKICGFVFILSLVTS